MKLMLEALLMWLKVRISEKKVCSENLNLYIFPSVIFSKTEAFHNLWCYSKSKGYKKNGSHQNLREILILESLREMKASFRNLREMEANSRNLREM